MTARKFLIGVDIQDIRKFRNIIDRSGNKFLEKVFTKREVEYCYRFKDPLPHLAARFSAKEAFIKALKPILGMAVLELNEVEVISRGGKPIFIFSEHLKSVLKELDVKDIELSLSHSGDYAVAIVLIIREAGPRDFEPDIPQ